MAALLMVGTAATGGGAWAVYQLSTQAAESAASASEATPSQASGQALLLQDPKASSRTGSQAAPPAVGWLLSPGMRRWLASERLWDALIGAAGVSGCLGVACGAYGFHGLRHR